MKALERYQRKPDCEWMTVLQAALMYLPRVVKIPRDILCFYLHKPVLGYNHAFQRFTRYFVALKLMLPDKSIAAPSEIVPVTRKLNVIKID